VATEKKLENKISPDPFREAELLNSASANENKRGPSLLQRMTKAAWPLRGPATEAKIQDKPHEQKSSGVNSEPPRNTISPEEKIAGSSESGGEAAKDTFSVETHYRDQGLEPSLKHPSSENSSSKKPEAKTSERVSEQKSFIGITRENTNSPSDGEEDLLDIPAFLRRQAN